MWLQKLRGKLLGILLDILKLTPKVLVCSSVTLKILKELAG